MKHHVVPNEVSSQLEPNAKTHHTLQIHKPEGSFPRDVFLTVFNTYLHIAQLLVF